MADATIKSANMITSAEHEAALIAKQANDDAKAVKDAAMLEAATRSEAAASVVRDANATLAEVKGEVDAAEATLAGLNEQIAKAESRLQAARDAAAKLLKGE